MFKRQSKMTDKEFVARVREVLERDYQKSKEEILAITGRPLVRYWYLCNTKRSAERIWRLRDKIDKDMSFTIREIDNKYISLEAR